MICTSCNKLAAMPANRNCNKCKNKIFTNIDILCSKCSDENKVCSRCLKNIGGGKNKFGCNCGKK